MIDTEIDVVVQALKDRFGEGLADISITQLLPERLRGRWRERMAAEDAAVPPMVYESGPNGVRAYQSPTDDDIAAAVLHTRAVLRLDEQHWKLKAKVAQLEAQLAAERVVQVDMRKGRRVLQQRLSAVSQLHWEAQQATCGDDGCCHEGLGWCQECGKETPWPCATYQAANGKSLPTEAGEDVTGD